MANEQRGAAFCGSGVLEAPGPVDPGAREHRGVLVGDVQLDAAEQPTAGERARFRTNDQFTKLGHCVFQIRPLGVETSQYPLRSGERCGRAVEPITEQRAAPVIYKRNQLQATSFCYFFSAGLHCLCSRSGTLPASSLWGPVPGIFFELESCARS
jgi:hypothetical protein